LNTAGMTQNLPVSGGILIDIGVLVAFCMVVYMFATRQKRALVSVIGALLLVPVALTAMSVEDRAYAQSSEVIFTGFVAFVLFASSLVVHYYQQKPARRQSSAANSYPPPIPALVPVLLALVVLSSFWSELQLSRLGNPGLWALFAALTELITVLTVLVGVAFVWRAARNRRKARKSVRYVASTTSTSDVVAA
jgi:hypothetical protein